MIAVSDLWKLKQHDLLAPEGFVEISYLVSEDGLQDEASASTSSEAVFSDVESVVDVASTRTKPKWATNELNLWMLDGSRGVLPGAAPHSNTGYVSNEFGAGSVKITLSEVHEQPVQGLTITWSEEFGEYATDFTVVVYNGNTEIARKAVSGNASTTSVVELDLANYDSVEIIVDAWNMPQHRVRIEMVVLGVEVVFSKKDIMSFKHEQTGSLVSGELPKNSIEFSLDNSSGKWNLNNPQGNEKYLSERQRVKARYGFNINGAVEWIKAGTFYLSEWSTPSNGLEATFVARDLLEYMIGKTYAGITEGTLYEMASDAIEQADLPSGAAVHLSEKLKNYSANIDDEYEYSIAEVLQMCANAAGCVMFQNRDGELFIEYVNTPAGDYRIVNNVSYSYPEFELAKPLKAIEITYGGDNAKYTRSVSESGEKQTLSNPFISTEAQAEEVAQWVENNLRWRKSIRGEYRADPRLDVFDKIAVESKYGVNNAVVITNIAYSFTGAFRGTYSGIVTEFDPVIAGYSGELYVGEVV